MRIRVATLAAAAGLAAAAPAAADTYTVTGGGDNSIPGGCARHGRAWTCNSLRGAVNESIARAGADEIVITAATVTLSFTTLALNDDVTIAGAGARATTIDAAGISGPAFRIGSSADAVLGHDDPGRNRRQHLGARRRDGWSVAGAGDRGQDGPGVLNEGQLDTTLTPDRRQHRHQRRRRHRQRRAVGAATS